MDHATAMVDAHLDVLVSAASVCLALISLVRHLIAQIDQSADAQDPDAKVTRISVKISSQQPTSTVV